MKQDNPVDDERTQQALSSEISQGSRTVDLDIQCHDLTVSLRTRSDVSADIVELSVQVKVLSEQLAHAMSQLEEANQKIGFLQAQVLIQQQELSRACSVQVDDLSSNQSHPKLPVY
jgi:uncharacterized protein YggE